MNYFIIREKLNCLRLYNNIYKVFSVNKLFNFGKNSFIVYGSMYNLFDRNNEKEAVYNYDYSIKNYTYYQNRMIYFGLVWSFAL